MPIFLIKLMIEVKINNNKTNNKQIKKYLIKNKENVYYMFSYSCFYFRKAAILLYNAQSLHRKYWLHKNVETTNCLLTCNTQIATLCSANCKLK